MQEKNIITNAYWSDNERFADIINVGIFKAKKVLSAEKLEEVNGILNTFIDKRGKKKGINRYRDVVKKAAFGTNFMIMGIENQTDIHYVMPVRVMGYDFMSYDKQWKEIKKQHEKAKDLKGAEYLSGFSKTDKLAPMCTLVLYYGEKPWDGPTRLSELLDFTDVPESVKEVIADYPIHVIDVRRFTESEKLESDARLLFGILQREGNAEEMRSYREENEEAFSNMREEAYDAIAILTKSEGILEMKERRKSKDPRQNLCKAFREMLEEDLRIEKEKLREQAREHVKQQVEEQVKQQVEEQVKQQVEEQVKQQVEEQVEEGVRSERITCIFELLRDLGNIPKEVEAEIFEEKDLYVLSRWFKIAAKSDTMEQFLETANL